MIVVDYAIPVFFEHDNVTAASLAHGIFFMVD